MPQRMPRATGTESRAKAPAALAEVRASTRAEWRAWLEAHHTQSASIWLVYPKKHHGSDLTYPAIVEEALCFGWIDSVPRKRDDGWATLRISPRKPKSAWSKANRERVARLTREGRMHSAGLAAVNAAKRNGSWQALSEVESLAIPDDLAAALARNTRARQNFDAFPPGSRKIILTWILGAKRPETRAARVAETVRLAAVNRRANHFRDRA